MPLTFADVYKLYRDAGAQGAGIGQQDLSSFAKDLNVWTGTREFDSANTGTLSGLVKKGSYWADVGLEKTRLPEATGWLGEQGARTLGVDPAFGREVGESIPRMAVDFAPMIAAGALATASAPVSIPAGVAMLGSGALTAANAWEKTGSPLQAATGFAMPAVGIGASKVASGVSSALLSRLSQYAPSLAKVGLTGGTTVPTATGTVKVAQTMADKLADYVAGNVGATLGTEALERGVNGSPGYDFFSKESLLANAIGNLPFAIYDLPKFTKDMPIAGTAKRIERAQAPEVVRPVVDEATQQRALAEMEYRDGMDKLAGITDPVEKIAAETSLVSKYKDVHDRLNPPKPADDKVMGLDKQELQTIAKNPWVVQLDPAKQALREKLRQPLPKVVETPEHVEAVIVKTGAENPWVSNYWLSNKIVGKVQEGDSPTKATKKVAQAIVNKADRQLSPTQKQKLEKEGRVMGELFTRAAMPDDKEAQVILAAIKPIYDNPDEHFVRNDIDKSQLKPELPSEIANIYSEWETARREGTPFGKSADAKPITGLPFEQQVGVLVGSLKNYINTYGYKMPKEVARAADDKAMSFDTKELAEARLAELGEGYKVGAYGKGKFAVFHKTPAMAVSKADVDSTTAVVEELVNSATTANAENLGSADRGVGEIYEEVIQEKIANASDDALTSAVLEDAETMKLIDANPELLKVKQTMMDTLSLSEGEAARALVERLLAKGDAGSPEALKKVLSNLVNREVSETDAIYEQQKAQQKAVLVQLEETFNNELAGYDDANGVEVPGYVEKAGQKWMAEDYANALRYASPGHEMHQQGVAHFDKSGKELKKQLLDKFIAERAPQAVRAMLGRIKAGDGFAYTMVPFDPLLNKLGKHPLPKGSLIEVKAFKRMATETGELKDEEIAFYKQLVPEAFEGEKVNVRALVEGLKEKGPQVKVETYGQDGKESAAKAELDKLTHDWVDAQPEAWRTSILRYAEGFTPNSPTWDYLRNAVDQTQLKKFRELKQQVLAEPRDSGPRATSYYNTISPFDTKKYPAVRVDVVLPMANDAEYQDLKSRQTEIMRRGLGDNNTEYARLMELESKRKGLWVQDGLHENLPNTLGWAMVQFVPDKNGQTVMFVGEQQSRWGQEAKKNQEKLERQERNLGMRGKDNIPDHPLLPFQHALVLKAAIAEAQKRGVTKMVVSDGETAMMTEGHDKGAMMEVLPTAENIAAIKKGKKSGLIAKRGTLYDNLEAGKPISIATNMVTTTGLVSTGKFTVSQSGGMRLHYDTTLTSEASRVTGDKGEKVELGAHKNGPSPIWGDKPVTGISYNISKLLNKDFSLFNSRFLLAGPQANRAPLTNLAKAKALYKGRDFSKLSDQERNQIWQETGWVLAPDGEYRFEINDSLAKLDKPLVAQLIQESKTLQRPRTVRLIELLPTHLELYKHEPSMADLRVRFDPEAKPYGANVETVFSDDGSFNAAESLIRIHPTQSDVLATLLHEIQHPIQDRNGFARGSNPQEMALVHALKPAARESLKEAINQRIVDADLNIDTTSWNELQWDKKLLSVFGNEIYRNTHGEIEAETVVERYLYGAYTNKFNAPFQNAMIDGEFYTVLPSTGTAFSIKKASPTGLKFKHHFDMPNFDRAFGMALENRGVDFETARELAGKMRTFLPALNLEDVRFGALVNDAKNGQEVLGFTTISGPMRKMWLAIDEAHAGRLDPNAAARDAMIKIAHEAGHGSEWLRNNGKLDAEGMKAHEDAENWFAGNAKEDVTGVLEVMRDTLLPKEWQDLPAMQNLMQYTSDPKEAMASAYGLWNLGMASKGIDAELLGSVAPKPVRGWLKNITERAMDVVSSIKTALGVSKDSGTAARRDQVNQLVRNFEKIRKNFAKGEENLDKLNRFTQVDSSDFELLKVSDIVFDSESSGSIGQQKMAAMLGRKKPPSDLAEGVYRNASRFGEYLEQFAARSKKFAEAAWAVLDAPGQKHSYMQRVMNPFVGEVDPTTGRPKPSKERSEQLKMLSENEGLREIISDIKRFQNREERFFEPGKDVQFASRISALPPKEKKAVEMYLAASKVKAVQEQQEILAFNEKISNLTTAKILSSFNPDGHDMHASSAELLGQAEMLRKQGDLQGAAQALAQADAQIGDVNARMAAQKFVQEAMEARGKLAEMFAKRPWFSSEIQTGKYRVIGYDKNGTRIGTVAAETEGDVEAVKKELRKQGAEKFDRQDIQRGFHFEMDESYRKLLEAVQMRMEASLNQNLNKAGVQAGDVHEMVQDMNLIGHMEQFSRASNPTAPQTRRLSKQAESLDMIATDKRYSKMMASVLVNNLTKSKLEFELMNPKTKGMDKERQLVKDSLKNYLQPDSELGKMIVRFQSPYLLGLNLPNHFAEMFQSLHTILPEAIRETGSVGRSAKVLGGVLKDLTNFYVARPFKGGKETWDHWGSKEEKRMMEKLGEEGLMTRHAYNEGLDDEGMAGTTSRYRATGSKLGGFAKSAVKAYSDFTMGIYENFTRFNMRVASLMGYRMAREKGVSHEDAIDRARRFAVTTTFSSGRAGRPTALFGGNDNTLGMIAYAMQRYSLGWMGMFGRNLQHSLGGTERMSELGLSPADVKAARKAAATMATVQFASAGAMGLPFVGAMTTILEKMLGQNIKGDVYEWFGQMMDEDDEEGGMLADVLMRGAANAMLDRAGVPIDLASKFALGGTPGFSELQGFDSGSIFGPTASLVKSLSLGVQSLAKDGDVLGFARQAFPPGLRKAVDLISNGDATSREGSKLGLSDWEQKLYALGFTPDKVRKMRDFERFNDANEIKRRRESARQGADILSLLETDPAGAMMKAQELVQQSDGSLTMREVANNVAEAAVKMQFPKDPRTEVTRADQGPAADILRGMGLQIGESQEMQKAQMKNQVLGMFGLAPRNLSRPAMVDQMAMEDPWLSSFSGAGR